MKIGQMIKENLFIEESQVCSSISFDMEEKKKTHFFQQV